MKFPSFRKRPEPTRIIKEKKEGCKIKVKRNESGKVIGYTDNGQCQKNQLDMFKESNGLVE